MTDRPKVVPISTPLPAIDRPATVSLLKRALDLMAGTDGDGARWCKTVECHAQNHAQEGAEPWGDDAVQVTVIGALARYGMPLIPLSPMPGLRNEGPFNAAWKYLFMAALLQGGAIKTPNGINNEGWPQTKTMLELAIKLAESDANILLTLAAAPDTPMGRELKERQDAAAAAQPEINPSGGSKPVSGSN